MMKLAQPTIYKKTQFEIETVYMMTKSIRTVLTPLLIISYTSGLNIIEFPVGYPRIWFSLLYMLLFWSIYFFLFNSTILYYFNNEHYTIIYQIGTGLDILMTLLSIVFGVYHEKVCMIKNR